MACGVNFVEARLVQPTFLFLVKWRIIKGGIVHYYASSDSARVRISLLHNINMYRRMIKERLGWPMAVGTVLNIWY